MSRRQPADHRRCRPIWAGAALGLALLLVRCVISPDPSLWQRKDGALDLGQADGASDRPRAERPPDGPAGEGAPDLTLDLAADLAPDAAVPPKLVCQTAALAGTPLTVAVTETALRASGLEVVASGGSLRYSATRSATDQPFGVWASTTDHPSGGDPTFFWHKGVELAVVARSTTSGGPRHLELCTLPNTCTAFSVKDKASGQEVTLDMDGPSVAVTASGLLMAHNIGPTGSSSGDIYLATPTDTSDLTKAWETTVVSSMALPGYKEDDPALSPDGLVIMFGGLNTAGDNDLWYSARATLTDAFPAPTQLSAVNSAQSDGNAYLAEVTIKGQAVLELYFTSDRDGTQKVYRSACAYTY